jgi:hypothetical protein
MALIAGCLAVLSTQAHAGPTCSPSDDSARILSAASRSAVHRDWRGGKHVGYGWSLQVDKSTRDATGTSYYVGDLYAADGSLSQRNVFVIENEWDCGP